MKTVNFEPSHYRFFLNPSEKINIRSEMEILQKHDFLSGLRYGSSVICQFVKMMFAKMVFADLKTIVSMIIHLISAVSKNANTFW